MLECLQAAVDFAFAAGDWFRRNGGAFSALFAAAVAAFTFYLACTTKKLWRATGAVADAAKRSADIAQSGLNPVLWPRIAVNEIGSVYLSETGPQSKINRSPNVVIEFENLGGSVAILESVRIAFVAEVDTPQETPIKSAISSNRAVRPGSFSNRFPQIFSPSEEQRAALLEQDLFLWLYGKVAFANVWGNHWETEFCFRYKGADATLAPHPQDRNKCTPKEG